MSCPYFSNVRRDSDLVWLAKQNDKEGLEDSSAPSDVDRMTYSTYLQLHKILDGQELKSSCGGTATPVHDEHLFVITHQAFELWFKQIIFEIDSVRNIFASSYLEERNQLTVISRLNRVVDILKLLCSQFPILETMTPQDFLELRKFLANASGFESLQFRLIEIKMGLREELRVHYNKMNYARVFCGDDRKKIETAKSEKSLFDLVNAWLARTPGLEEYGFNFFSKFKSSVHGMLLQEKAVAEECVDEERRHFLLTDNKRHYEVFGSLFDEKQHEALVIKGHRRFSHKAMQGALMVYLYRDEPRCHLPFQVLQSLMDIDTYFTKLRYSHTCMVQRMIGTKIGTAGSSGYLYLRSTCSDRYKVFIDLMNLSSFLVTRDRIPPLTENIKRSLSIHDWLEDDNCVGSDPLQKSSETDNDSGIVSSIYNSLSRRLSRNSTGSSDKILESFLESDEKSDSTV